MKPKQFILGRGQSVIWKDWPLKHKVYVCCAGEQGGKTSLGAKWFKRFIKGDEKQKGDLRGQYIVGTPSYKISEQATKPALVQSFRGLGQYNEKDDTFDLDGGGRIWVRTSKDPDSIVGITNCKGAWLDEAGKMPRQFFYNIQSRLARMSGVTLITSTPYAMNWLATLVKDAEEGKGSVLYSRWSASENPTYPPSEIERLRQILPPSVFRRRVEGFHEQLEGLVFEHWSRDNTIARDQINLEGAIVYGGVDWGFTHPMAVVVWALCQDGGIYVISIFRKSGLSSTQQLELIQAKTRLLGVKAWSCGHDRPDMIHELGLRKVTAYPYFQGKNHLREVNAGNQKLSEIIQSKRLKVVKVEQWEDLDEEFSTYAWEEAVEDNVKERPVSVHDDLIASMRYACVGMSHLFTEKPLLSRIPLNYYSQRDLWKPNKVKIDTDQF